MAGSTVVVGKIANPKIPDGSTVGFADGTAALPSMAFASDPDTGFHLIAAANIGVSIAGVEKFRFGSAGRYGIAGANPGVQFGPTMVTCDVILERQAAGTLGIFGASTAAAGHLRKYGGNAGYVEWGSVTELITLSTSGTTTDSTADLLPANSVIEGVTATVTTAIATATDWSLGDATTAARFSSAESTLTVGTTKVGLNHMQGGISTDATGPVQAAAAKLRITTTGTPSAGAIRVTTYYRKFVPATS